MSVHSRAAGPTRRSKSDPLAKRPGGEPCFILRGQDQLAPELVETWAIEAELNGYPPAKVAEARRIAVAMRRWPKRKIPD